MKIKYDGFYAQYAHDEDGDVSVGLEEEQEDEECALADCWNKNNNHNGSEDINWVQCDYCNDWYHWPDHFCMGTTFA